MPNFSPTEGEAARNEINWVSVAASLFMNALENRLRRAVVAEVDPHLDMAQTEQLQFAKRLPSAAVERTWHFDVAQLPEILGNRARVQSIRPCKSGLLLTRQALDRSADDFSLPRRD